MFLSPDSFPIALILPDDFVISFHQEWEKTRAWGTLKTLFLTSTYQALLWWKSVWRKEHSGSLLSAAQIIPVRPRSAKTRPRDPLSSLLTGAHPAQTRPANYCLRGCRRACLWSGAFIATPAPSPAISPMHTHNRRCCLGRTAVHFPPVSVSFCCLKNHPHIEWLKQQAISSAYRVGSSGWAQVGGSIALSTWRTYVCCPPHAWLCFWGLTGCRLGGGGEMDHVSHHSPG